MASTSHKGATGQASGPWSLAQHAGYMHSPRNLPTLAMQLVLSVGRAGGKETTHALLRLLSKQSTHGYQVGHPLRFTSSSTQETCCSGRIVFGYMKIPQHSILFPIPM